MSKSSGIGIVVALIIFVVLLFVVIGKRGHEEKVGVKELKVQKIDKDAVTKFEVTVPPPKTPAAAGPDAGPAKSTDAPKKVVLEKDGAQWKVYDPATADKKFLADDAQVKTALDAVGEFATGDLISNKKEKLADLEIDEAKGTTVTVFTKEGKGLDLVFGRPAKGGGSTVRTAGSDEVFVAKGRLGSVLKKDLSQWRKKTLFDMKPDDVTRVATTLADGKKLVVEATTPPAPPPSESPDAGPPPPAPKPEWKLVEPATLPAGFRLDSAQLSRSAAAVATLRAQDFADGVSDDAAGLKDAHTVVEASTKDGKKVTVHLGKEDDKKRVYAKVDGDPQTYLLASYSAKQLQRTLDDLRDLTLADAKVDDVEKATFKGSQGTIVVKKDGADWKLVEPKKAPDGFDASQIAGQVASVLRTRATKVATDAPANAVDAKASPTVELVLKGGKKQVLRFGAPLPVDDAKDAKPDDKKAKDPKKNDAREYYAKGGVDDLTYVVAAFTRNRLDKPNDLFKKPPAPPQGMGGPGGSIPGMENLPPDVRKKLEESMRKGDFPPNHP